MISLLMSWTRTYKGAVNHPWLPEKRKTGLTAKVAGTSLVETVVSMTLLLTILSLSFVALDRINKSVNPGALYKAYLATNELISRDDLLLTEADEYHVKGYVIKKHISIQRHGMCLVELSVYRGQGKAIYVRKIFKSYEIRL